MLYYNCGWGSDRKLREVTMLLNEYLSPENERSVFKNIPMSLRMCDEIQNLMMTREFSIKYRGRSTKDYKRNPSYCTKANAETFAIYPYSNYDTNYKNTVQRNYDELVAKIKLRKAFTML
jgi:hypothetical protein